MRSAQKAKLFSLKYFFHDFVRITGAIPGLIWLRPKRIYQSESAKRKIRGGALLISNHIGCFDPAYLMFAVWYRRHNFICSEELMQSGAGKWLRAVGCIEVNRQNTTLGSFREIIAHLKSGELVSMFPEGHISAEKTSQFKSGMVLMALKSGAPIVPVYIQPRKRFFSRLRVVIGESVSVAELYGERPSFAQLDECARLLYEREEKLKSCL